MRMRSARTPRAPMGGSTGQDDGQEKLASEPAMVAQSEGAEPAIVGTSVAEAVRDCLHELADDDERQAILLYYLGGKVCREIGEILGKSLSMGRNRVKSGPEKVRRCPEGKGIDSLPS